jgi:peptide/nickel transport system substrate-binding protein
MIWRFLRRFAVGWVSEALPIGRALMGSASLTHPTVWQCFRRFAVIVAFVIPPMASTAAIAQKTTLSVGLVLEPPGLDPTINPADPIRSITNGNIFEGLTWIGEDGKVVPRLATGWTVSADGLTYDFTLRANVRFHNRTKFDCSIVRYAFTRAAAPDSTNAQKPFFVPIKDIACPQPLRAVITLKQKVGNFPYELAWEDAAMVAPDTEPSNATHPVGTGPYKFASWRRGDSVSLERNDDYWGAKPAIRDVTFRFIPDPLAEANALLSGELDAFPAFQSADLLPRLRGHGGLTVTIGTFPIKVMLVLNELRKPFDDVRVRRALAYAIDREGMVQAFGMPGTTLIGSHMSPSDPDYVDLSKRYPYDPQKAQQLLAAAGVSPGFKLNIA